MKDCSNYKAYLNEISENILESARDAIKDRKNSKKNSEEYYLNSGRVQAYYDVLLYFRDYLDAFNIDPEEVHLDDINLEKELF